MCVGLIGAFAGYKLAQLNQKLMKRRERYLKIYNLLIDFRTQFELLTFAFNRKDQSKINKLIHEINLKKYELNDELRCHDVKADIEITANILLKFKTHTLWERIGEIDKLLKYWGQQVNKKHFNIMHKITQENLSYILKNLEPPEIP